MIGIWTWVLNCPFILVHLVFIICFLIKQCSSKSTLEMKSFVAIEAQFTGKLNEIVYFIGYAAYFYGT